MALPVIDHATWKDIEKAASKVECNKCGKCCRLPSGKDCRYLLRLADGLTHCRIYARAGRIGTPIGEGQVCNNVMRVPVLWSGCPYNAIKRQYGLVEEGEEEKK